MREMGWVAVVPDWRAPPCAKPRLHRKCAGATEIFSCRDDLSYKILLCS
jgi:hypothetical protein